MEVAAAHHMLTLPYTGDKSAQAKMQLAWTSLLRADQCSPANRDALNHSLYMVPDVGMPASCVSADGEA